MILKKKEQLINIASNTGKNKQRNDLQQKCIQTLTNSQFLVALLYIANVIGVAINQLIPTRNNDKNG